MKASKARKITKMDSELQAIFDMIKKAAKSGEYSIKYNIYREYKKELEYLGYSINYESPAAEFNNEPAIISW